MFVAGTMVLHTNRENYLAMTLSVSFVSQRNALIQKPVRYHCSFVFVAVNNRVNFTINIKVRIRSIWVSRLIIIRLKTTRLKRFQP